MQVDLHVHTPASADYQEPDVSFLDILHQAERKGLDIIAFTDHNTVAGYRVMMEEIHKLELLEELGRLRNEEKKRLDEYRRVRKNVLVLPGVEFTATFGFHILGIFSPEKDVREIEFLLRQLNIPLEKLDAGSPEVGATSDVLTAYRAMAEQGGIVIAAHANANNGVAMRGFDFGGQTRIAYTQDPHLHALEVTDLEKRGRRTTLRFFDGSKPEYPRAMRCIQGSDAHRLTQHPKDSHRLGIGDRSTEVLLPETSFEALREVFIGDDFTRTRPFRSTAKEPFDHVQAAQEEGASIVQAFHERYSRRGGHLYAILSDVCAFANTNGGTIYVGVSPDPNKPPRGLSNPGEAIKSIQSEVSRRITPKLEITPTVQKSQNKTVVRISVPRGEETPYAIDDNKIYVRSESETGLAVRDEIVSLVERALMPSQVMPGQTMGQLAPPRTGVEIVDTEVREGVRYHTMHDLRNGNRVKNVTRKSARKLWRYAITQKEDHPVNPNELDWHGSIAVARKRSSHGRERYDLVQRDDGELRVYYGVTEDGIHGSWTGLVDIEESS
jgi:PHP family Zn ribbon phosphoesterase